MAQANKAKKAYLVLQDGTVMQGYSMGAQGVTIGEVVFNTCTASYQDLLSDPTYYGQIVAQTYPLVGNRGFDAAQGKSEIMANGYIAREWCDTPTDARNGVTLDTYLKSRGIVGLCGIDTRRLTRILRDKGYFNGAITDTLDNLEELLEKIKAYTIAGAVEQVTIREPEVIEAENAKYHMVIMDYGFHREILQWFTKRGCKLTLVPAGTSPQDVLAYQPDGILLSDGPGDPDDNLKLIENIRELTKSGVPLFGLGLGHQMLALAVGAKIQKMSRGHRGSNQPVRILSNGKVMITTQNHGYDVDKDSLDPAVAEITMENVNDQSVEGIVYHAFPAFTVQFEPCDGKGFQDSAWIYDEFVAMMKGEEHNA